MSDLISETKICTICTEEFSVEDGKCLIKGDRAVCQHCLEEGKGDSATGSLLLG